MDKQGTPHGGILYRGATGDMYLMLDDDKEPRRINNPAITKSLEGHAKKGGTEREAGNDLPEDILEFLNEEFGPLIGIWWVWGPRTAS